MYIGDRSDLKFSQKNFTTKLKENEEFRNVFVSEVLAELQNLIYDPGEADEVDTGFDVTSQILNNIQMAA